MYKVVIVEDERIIRQGILTLINWETLGCVVVADFANGMDTLEYMKQHKVDLVITDIIMPQLNGLELCEHISHHYPHTKMLILSSHSDFAYAKEALRYGVNDYIIKSNFVKELPPAVSKVVTEIEDCSKSNAIPIFEGQDLDEVKIMFLERIFHDQNSDEKKVNQLISLLGHDLNHYYILFSDLEYIKTPCLEKNQYTSIINFYTMVFQDTWHISFWRDNHSIVTLVNFHDDSPTLNLQQLVMQCNKILSTVTNYMSFQLNISISKCHHSLQELKLAYEEATSNLNTLDTENNLYLYQDSQHSEYTIPEKNDVIKKFLHFIHARDATDKDSYLTELFTAYQYASTGLEQTKIDLLIILSHCFRIIAEKDISSKNLEQLEADANTMILQCNALHSLYKFVGTLLEDLHTLTQSTQTHNNSLVLYVNSYIKEHYNSSIKLGDIAKELHVNSSYLSRLYKSKTGDSIITSVNKYRINKAKELLERGNHLVSEVGCMVGIDDPAYFTNVFTKHVGISPKNYKLK